MKKLLFSLGSVAAVVAPVAVVVSCGKDTPKMDAEQASRKINALLQGKDSFSDSEWTAAKATGKAWLEVGTDMKSLTLNDSDGTKSIFNVDKKAADFAKYLPLATKEYKGKDAIGSIPSSWYQTNVDGLRWLKMDANKASFIDAKTEKAFDFIVDLFGLDKAQAKTSLVWGGYTAMDMTAKKVATKF